MKSDFSSLFYQHFILILVDFLKALRFIVDICSVHLKNVFGNQMKTFVYVTIVQFFHIFLIIIDKERRNFSHVQNCERLGVLDCIAYI